MSLHFNGGERLQRGRGIGGLLQLVKSVFSPLVKSAGKSIVKAVTSNTGKAVMNTIKDQAIDSGMKLATSALRGEDMDESLQEEMQKVKRKAADGLESVRRMKKQRTTKPEGFMDNVSYPIIIKQSLSHSKNIKQKTKQNQLKRRKKNKGLWDLTWMKG